MVTYTVEEQIACQVARSFGPEDDFVVSAVNNCTFVGLALAQELYAPRLAFSLAAKGKSALLSSVRYPFMLGNPPERFIETFMEMEDIFELVARGKWCIVMQPVQIDQYGRTNLSLVGDVDKPSVVFVGSRGLPDNTVNAPRVYYFIPNHNKRTFVPNVDFVSGVGYNEERQNGLVKWGEPHKVFTNLGVFGFDAESGRMRVISVHTGVTIEQIKENTGFELLIPEPLLETEPPSVEELRLLRGIIDPQGIGRLDFAKGETHKQVLGEIMRGSSYNMVYGRK